MKAYGSLQNRLSESNFVGAPVPVVGMGVTFISYSDRDPGTIRKVDPKGNRFWVTPDLHQRTDDNGMSECQEYAYSVRDDIPEENWMLVTWKKARKSHDNPKGEGGRWLTANGQSIVIGRREKYYDFSF